MEYNLTSVIQARKELNEALEIEDEQYTTYLSNYKAQIHQLDEAENALKHNLDITKFKHGQTLLNLQFPCKSDPCSNKRTYRLIYDSLVDAAKHDIAGDVSYLKTRYIGQKYYDGYDQRTDCEYGYGPTHGTIYQRIGLANPKKELTEYDRECCLYVLENLDVIVENLNKRENM